MSPPLDSLVSRTRALQTAAAPAEAARMAASCLVWRGSSRRRTRRCDCGTRVGAQEGAKQIHLRARLCGARAADGDGRGAHACPRETAAADATAQGGGGLPQLSQRGQTALSAPIIRAPGACSVALLVARCPLLQKISSLYRQVLSSLYFITCFRVAFCARATSASLCAVLTLRCISFNSCRRLLYPSERLVEPPILS